MKKTYSYELASDIALARARSIHYFHEAKLYQHELERLNTYHKKQPMLEEYQKIYDRIAERKNYLKTFSDDINLIRLGELRIELDRYSQELKDIIK